jgi:hypothetical protein
MLEAHEALIKAVPENLPKFKDVMQHLEEELHLSKGLFRKRKNGKNRAPSQRN